MAVGGTIRQTGQPNKDMNTVNFIQAGQADVDLILPGSTSIGCTRTSGTGSWAYTSSTKTLTLNFTTGQSSDFYLTGTGICGSGNRTVTFAVSSGGYGYTVAPNPATDYVTITAVKDENSPEGKMVRDEDLSYQVFIYNVSNVLLRQGQNAKGQKQTRLNITGLKTGVYFVVIKNGKNVSYQQLLVK